MNDYEKEANEFATKHGVELKVISEHYDYHFEGDTEQRWIFNCDLSRNGETYNFNFGQSISNGAKEPTMYDVLSCLTKYDPGSFEDFCGEYSYDNDSCSAERIYNSVVKEFENVELLFSDIMEELQEIQ